MDHARHCAEFIAYFRRRYRPVESVLPDFERDLDRLVHEVTVLAYRNAQAPFIEGLFARINLGPRVT